MIVSQNFVCRLRQSSGCQRREIDFLCQRKQREGGGLAAVFQHNIYAFRTFCICNTRQLRQLFHVTLRKTEGRVDAEIIELLLRCIVLKGVNHGIFRQLQTGKEADA